MKSKYIIVLGCALVLSGCTNYNSSPNNTPAKEATTMPSKKPTKKPSAQPTTSPTINPTKKPTAKPTEKPTKKPTDKPDINYKTQKYSWDSSWEFASYSVINSDTVTLYKTESKSPKNITVCVNAGHGTSGGESKKVQCHPDGSPKYVTGSSLKGSTSVISISSGTVLNDGTAEATATKELGIKLKETLLANGYDVLMIRENDNVQLDNIARTVFANNLADCHIALHYDSSQNDKGAYYISVPNIDSYLNMYPVSTIWNESNKLGESVISGLKSENIKVFGSGSMTIDLVQMSYSTIPNIDIEVGDRGSDHSNSTLKTLANGIAKGLNEFYEK